MNNTIKRFWLENRYPWWSMIILCLAMLGVAMYYQYALEEPPCSLCIHFRILLIVVIIISLFGLYFRSRFIGRTVVLTALLATSLLMAERAYILLGTERVFLNGECSFDLGLPAWFAIDQWVPWLFAPQTTCGYTPYLLFNITMAEALIVFSAVMILLSIWMISGSAKHR